MQRVRNWKLILMRFNEIVLKVIQISDYGNVNIILEKAASLPGSKISICSCSLIQYIMENAKHLFHTY